MKTTLKEISPVKKRLEVEIEAREVDKKINQAYLELKGGVKIPGFRPGRVPRKILEGRFKNQVMEDVTRKLVNETLPQAVEETKAYPLTMPVIENKVLKTGQNFKYSALLEVRPQIDLKDYMGIEVQKEICVVTDEDVCTQLEEIRKARGRLTSIGENRAIREGDYVVIDYQGYEGETAMEGVQGNNSLVRIGGNDLHTDIEKGLIGLSRGDRTDIQVEFEENHHQAILAGKRVNFKVKVLDVKEMILHELNDEFAKALDVGLEDLDSLKKWVKESLIKKEENRIDREVKMRLLKKITDSVHFELPESLVESELDGAIENIKQNLIRSGSNMERASLSEEKLRQDLRPASESRVKEMLVLGEIAKRDGLAINDRELSQGFREMALTTGQEPEALRKYYEANHLVETFRRQLLEEKALNYLVKGAKITEAPGDKLKGEQQGDTA